MVILQNRNNMNKKITLSYPTSTIPISVTGNHCNLNCKHCGGFYLGSMKGLDFAAQFAEIDANSQKSAHNNKTASSFLISGGCNMEGAVPVWEHLSLLKSLKARGYLLNIHTGLIPPNKIPLVAPLADVISFDFIVDDEAIETIYGGRRAEGGERIAENGRRKADEGDYIQTFLELRKYAPVVPHITIGIPGGKISGEIDAVRELSLLGCERIIFLVFMPTKGTFYEKCGPPSPGDIENIFALARNLLPKASFGLGCMHPRGKYKFELEMLAYKYGFDSFVNPTKRFRSRLDSIKENRDGISEIVICKECCALC